MDCLFLIVEHNLCLLNKTLIGLLNWVLVLVYHVNIDRHSHPANRKKNDRKKTGGGPPTVDYTPAEDNNQGRPIMDGVAGGVTSDPGQGTSSQYVQGRYSNE